MKKLLLFTSCLLVSIFLAAGFSGCAGMGASQTEDLLSAAGFTPFYPKTPAQEKVYADLRPYKMETAMVKNRRLYGFKDEKKGVVYVGGEKQYQEYKRLQVQRNIAMDNLEAAQMNSSSSNFYNAFGPSYYWR